MACPYLLGRDDLKMTLEQLSEVSELHSRIYSLEQDLEILKQNAYPAASRMTGMPHSLGISDRTAILVSEIDELECDIADLKQRLDEKIVEVRAFSKTIPDIETRTIFRLRFIHGLLWKEIGSLIGKTDKNVSIRCLRYLKKVNAETVK